MYLHTTYINIYKTRGSYKPFQKCYDLHFLNSNKVYYFQLVFKEKLKVAEKNINFRKNVALTIKMKSYWNFQNIIIFKNFQGNFFYFLCDMCLQVSTLFH